MGLLVLTNALVPPCSTPPPVGGRRPAPQGPSRRGERPARRRVEALPATLWEDQDHGVLRVERREYGTDELPRTSRRRWEGQLLPPGTSGIGGPFIALSVIYASGAQMGVLL